MRTLFTINTIYIEPSIICLNFQQKKKINFLTADTFVVNICNEHNN